MASSAQIWKAKTRATDGAPPVGSALAEGSEKFEAIVGLGNGGFLIIWQDDRSYQAEVFDFLGRPKSVIDLVDYWPDSAARPLDQAPVVAELADGTVAIGLDGFAMENSVAVDRFQMVRVSASGAASPPEWIDFSLDYNKAGLELAPLPGGGFVAGYSQTATGMFAFERFDQAGEAQLTASQTADMADAGHLFDNLSQPSDARPSIQTVAPVATDLSGLAGGAYLVVWASGNAGDQTVFGRMFDASGQPVTTPLSLGGAGSGREFRITADGAANTVSGLLATALSGGGFAVLFRDETASGRSGLFLSVYGSDGALKTAVADVVSAGSELRDAAAGAVLVALADGGFGLVWRETDDPGGAATDRLKLQLFDAEGSATTTQVELASGGPGTLSPVSPVELADGTLLLGWADEDDPAHMLVAHYGRDGTMIGDAFAPFAAAAQSDHAPQFALLGDGRVAVSIDAGDQQTHFAILDFRGKQIAGTAGADLITSRMDGASVAGNGGNDRLYGQDGKDVLLGGAGRDSLFGGKSVDRLAGGKGNDFLRGDQGRDLFVFAKKDGKDLIADFHDRQDKIDLRAFHFASAKQALKYFSDLGNSHDHQMRFDFAGTHIVIKGIDPGHFNGEDILV
ncbi:MAG: hypothetical protein H6873_02160 [Hyphomicrobiaceae bacterium]|nr:hypothetical protein [Hyphomicrobiaceae bacterium]